MESLSYRKMEKNLVDGGFFLSEGRNRLLTPFKRVIKAVLTDFISLHSLPLFYLSTCVGWLLSDGFAA